MLTEFALSPAVFDEIDHEDTDDWLDQLRELASGLFPKTAVCSSIVANLYAGGWRATVKNAAERLSDHRVRVRCMALLQQIDKVLVNRPACGEWPTDEVAWVREAIACHAIEPIDRIVTVDRTRKTLQGEYPELRSIDEVLGGGFWHGIQATASPTMVVNEQVRLLRKICIHSDWIALVNPYGCTSEQRFGCDLILENLRNTSQMGPKHFELHTALLEGGDAINRQTKAAAHIQRLLQPHLGTEHCIHIYHWPQLRDRIFLGGTFVPASDGVMRKSPKWGVALNHVAHDADQPVQRTHWSLLSREDITYWFDQYISETATGKPAAIRICRAADVN